MATGQAWEPYLQIVRWRERQAYRLEHDDLHVLAMVNALGGDTDAETLNVALREDDDLRQSTFWRIFEVEESPRVNPRLPRPVPR